MKKLLSFSLIIIGLLIVTQGLFLRQIIPLEPFMLLTGINSNTLGLFIIPFVIFLTKFSYLILGPFITFIIEFKKNIGKKFDPNLPSASLLGSLRFNVSKNLMNNYYSFFASLISEFFRWVILLVLVLTIAGVYVYFDLIENDQEEILPLILNVITGFSMVLLPLGTSRKKGNDLGEF